MCFLDLKLVKDGQKGQSLALPSSLNWPFSGEVLVEEIEPSEDQPAELCWCPSEAQVVRSVVFPSTCSFHRVQRVEGERA